MFFLHICQGQRARGVSLSLNTLKQKKPAVKEIRGVKNDEFLAFGFVLGSVYCSRA